MLLNNQFLIASGKISGARSGNIFHAHMRAEKKRKITLKGLEPVVLTKNRENDKIK